METTAWLETGIGMAMMLTVFVAGLIRAWRVAKS